MATLSVTYNFAPNTLAEADKVDQNFTDIVSFVNTNCIQKDASLAFTNIPSGPASDPSGDNQFARKRYVDRKDQRGFESLTFSSQSALSGTVTYATAFTAAPHIFLTVQCGSNFDLIGNVTTIPTTTGFGWRVFQNSGSSFSGSARLYWIAFGAY